MLRQSICTAGPKNLAVQKLNHIPAVKCFRHTSSREDARFRVSHHEVYIGKADKCRVIRLAKYRWCLSIATFSTSVSLNIPTTCGVRGICFGGLPATMVRTCWSAHCSSSFVSCRVMPRTVTATRISLRSRHIWELPSIK